VPIIYLTNASIVVYYYFTCLFALVSAFYFCLVSSYFSLNFLNFYILDPSSSFNFSLIISSFDFYDSKGNSASGGKRFLVSTTQDLIVYSIISFNLKYNNLIYYLFYIMSLNSLNSSTKQTEPIIAT
jgi:hypothetical protein